MRRERLVAVLSAWSRAAALLACCSAAAAQEAGSGGSAGKSGKAAEEGTNMIAERKALTWDKAGSVLDFVMKDIEGRDVDLGRYKGDVLLIVNVASRCGYTPQYQQLQELFDKYRGQGLRVLAFPSNDFGGQEPADNDKIREFCKTRFGVTFDLFAKVPVKGENATELYKFLTAESRTGAHAGDIRWNFTKFLVNRKGEVIARYESKVKPDAPQVISAIEAALAEKKD